AGAGGSGRVLAPPGGGLHPRRGDPRRRRLRIGHGQPGPPIESRAPMIYCVVPAELADELYPKLAKYYEEDPNVKVIIDRRKSDRRSGEDRRAGEREEEEEAAPIAEVLPIDGRREQ